MDDGLLIGLDLGTTNAKAAAYTLNGELVAQASVSYPTFYPEPGMAEQRPSHWTAALSDTVRHLLAELGSRRQDVMGIGLSAHGPGLVLVDEHGAPLLDACATWQDERFIPQGKRLLERVGAEWVGLGMPLSGFPARLLWAIETHPDTAARARYALGIKDYLAGWLTGRFAAEPSSGPGRDTWWTPVFDACGWPLERLAPVLSSTAVVGEVRPPLADDLDLPRGLPVVMGLNDGASATLAGGLARAGEAMVTLATNGVARMVLSQPIPPQTRLEHGLFCWPYVDGLWVAGGFTKCGAAALEWFAGLLTDQPLRSDIDGLLKEAAECPPGSRGVMFLPYLAGRGTPHNDPAATGTFCGLTLAHRRADLARSVLEGTAFALHEIYDHFARMGYPVGQVHISGGGARSPVWRQVVADVLNRQVIHYATDSTLGAAAVAAVGLGQHTDFRSALQAMTRPLGETEPRSAAFYPPIFAEFQRLRDTLFPSRGVYERAEV